MKPFEHSRVVVDQERDELLQLAKSARNAMIRAKKHREDFHFKVAEQAEEQAYLATKRIIERLEQQALAF